MTWTYVKRGQFIPILIERGHLGGQPVLWWLKGLSMNCKVKRMMLFNSRQVYFLILRYFPLRNKALDLPTTFLADVFNPKTGSISACDWAHYNEFLLDNIIKFKWRFWTLESTRLWSHRGRQGHSSSKRQHTHTQTLLTEPNTYLKMHH
jgi:hypothetical protein